MSVATDILKMLSDLSAAADKINEENISQIKPPRLKEWTSIVNEKADSIVEGEGSAESGEIRSLVSYLKGSSEKGPRVSTVLVEIHRMHLHGKKRSSKRPDTISSKTPLRASIHRKSKAKTMVDSENTPKLKFTPTVIKKTKFISDQNYSLPSTSFTPVEKATMEKKKVDRSSKRRSSSELSLENLKKSKIDELNENDSNKEKVQKISPPSAGVEKKQMNSSMLPNIKSSVGATNFSVLKETRAFQSKLQTKKQDKAVENRKIIMALRQKKLEETKKTREEKMQKAQTMRLKLENEKKEFSKLKSGKGDHTKVSMKSEKQHPSSKKTPQVKKNGKNKQETEKTVNTTYIAFGGEKPSTPHNSKGPTKTVKPLIEKQKELNSAGTSTPKEKRGPESYAITPARSSFVSYDISEIRSDSEEEEQDTNSKPIPSWATGFRLRNALVQQHYCRIDTDELFGNVVGLPDLAQIMGVKKKLYYKRTSSALWNSSFSFS